MKRLKKLFRKKVILVNKSLPIFMCPNCHTELAEAYAAMRCRKCVYCKQKLKWF